MQCQNEGCSNTKIRARGYCGTCYNRGRREGWFEIRKQVPSSVVDDWVVDYVKNCDFKPSVRYLYYRATDEGILERGEGSYAKLVLRVRDLRKEGRISWEKIVDESREATVFSHFDNSEESPAEAMLGNIECVAYNVSPWRNKDVIAELWVESKSAAGSLQNFCRQLQIDLVPLSGHTSWAYIYDQAKKIRERNKATHIICLSDWDQAGMVVSGQAKEKIDFFMNFLRSSLSVTFDRVGMNEDMVEKYGLQTLPPSKDIKSGFWAGRRRCDIESMELEDLIEFLEGAFSKYITVEDVKEASDLRYELIKKTYAIEERLREVIREEFEDDEDYY